ncbi:hypothetical protein F1654_08555 [Alkalicaulis satelles]|uniref:Uncharacterized protein n=1 Tax=Alkalicaulis satelles TaxID=2609175 RepID=A0A5M6ZGJ4_9PROT|nr:DUF6489 family protein [Alkalicaulis satelles]KAA5803839.1 hypothetical protein F1654_08555 [Alkalicaulis satelles]
MKVNIEIDCTPQEARAFFGLPDVTPLNEKLVAEMSERLSANMSAMEPEALMRSWMTFGGEWQKQFMDLMGKAAGGPSR